MSLIADFYDESDFDSDINNLKSFLKYSLLIDTEEIDKEIRKCANGKQNPEILVKFSALCLEHCYPYTFNEFLQLRPLVVENATAHPIRCNDFYEDALKTQTIISFCYSYELYRSERIKFCDLLELDPDRDAPDFKVDTTSSYYKSKLQQKDKALKETLGESVYPFIIDSLFSKNKKNLITLKPAKVDSELIFNLLFNTTHSPYNQKKFKKGFTLENLLKFTASFSNITLDIKNKAEDDYTSSAQALINNYLIERFLHLDFIAYLLKLYYCKYYNNDIFKGSLFDIFIKLAAIPNIFSRQAILDNILEWLAHDSVHSNSMTIKESVERIKLFIFLVSRCTLPVMSLTFRYILKRYYEYSSCTKENDSVRLLCRIYMDKLISNKKYTIYRNNTKTSGITSDNIEYIREIKDKDHICKEISRIVFNEIMSPYSYHRYKYIDYNNFLDTAPGDIKALRESRINILVKKDTEDMHKLLIPGDKTLESYIVTNFHKKSNNNDIL